MIAEYCRLIREMAQWAKQHGWSDFVYAPYYPLVITKL